MTFYHSMPKKQSFGNTGKKRKMNQHLFFPTCFPKPFILRSLTLSHTILTFNEIENRSLLKTLWAKEKMLVTSIFSFIQNVFFCQRKIAPSRATFKLSSANASSLFEAKNLLLIIELTLSSIF